MLFIFFAHPRLSTNYNPMHGSIKTLVCNGIAWSQQTSQRGISLPNLKTRSLSLQIHHSHEQNLNLHIWIHRKITNNWTWIVTQKDGIWMISVEFILIYKYKKNQIYNLLQCKIITFSFHTLYSVCEIRHLVIYELKVLFIFVCLCFILIKSSNQSSRNVHTSAVIEALSQMMSELTFAISIKKSKPFLWLNSCFYSPTDF